MLDHLLEEKYLPKRAKLFAEIKHKYQLRADGKTPYMQHLLECSQIAFDMGLREEYVTAMFLHDTLEDTDTSFEELVDYFGKGIANMVDDLSDKYTTDDYPDLNREQRKTLEWKRYTACGGDIQTLKLIDMYSNTLEIQDLDLEFALVCLQERKVMLTRFKRADPRIKEKLRTALSKIRLFVKRD